MKVTYISTYPPRECGLASFNRNLMTAIESNFCESAQDHQGSVIAINAENNDEYEYPSEVKFVIKQQNLEDYNTAVDIINLSNTDACILQHEFGIFGGDSGVYVLSLINQIQKPIITILHTVLERPTNQQKVIIQSIAKRSDRVVVMGKSAISLLKKIYNVSPAKISYIEHGAPDIEAPVNNPLKADPLFRDNKVLLTFGLISRNKGLETVIRALPRIVNNHPDVKYVVLGATHPGIRKNSGEEYREYLIKIAEELGVSNHLVFINHYVAENELINYLSAADIYISPYLNEAQITSGTLSYAVGAGAAIVATPYWHARELLAENRGKLFGFKDEKKLAATINELLEDPQASQQIRNNAYKYGTKLRWPVIGEIYLNVLRDIVENVDLSEQILRQVIDPELMPELNLDYVRLLTDSTGIIQHAKYGIPDWKEGYCVDDNSRALIMALMACQLNFKEAAKLVPTYMSFLLYMQNDAGYFRNFLSYDHKYLDKIGSEDAFGRTIWALGYMVHSSHSSSYSKLAEDMFCKAAPHFKTLNYLRGISNTIIGISYYLKVYPSNIEMLGTLNYLTDVLIDAYENISGDDWKWFENTLTYDNAILPLALLHSAEITDNEKVLNIAFESINFLEKLTVNSKHWNPVGNDGWYYRDGKMPLHDQQAIETMAMVLMYGQAYELTRNKQFLKKLFSVYEWFLGENLLNIPLYDVESGGCSDGLQPHGTNQNQGAESLLAYLISHLTVLQKFKGSQGFNYDLAAMETVSAR